MAAKLSDLQDMRSALEESRERVQQTKKARVTFTLRQGAVPKASSRSHKTYKLDVGAVNLEVSESEYALSREGYSSGDMFKASAPAPTTPKRVRGYLPGLPERRANALRAAIKLLNERRFEAALEALAADRAQNLSAENHHSEEREAEADAAVSVPSGATIDSARRQAVEAQPQAEHHTVTPAHSRSPARPLMLTFAGSAVITGVILLLDQMASLPTPLTLFVGLLPVLVPIVLLLGGLRAFFAKPNPSAAPVTRHENRD